MQNYGLIKFKDDKYIAFSEDFANYLYELKNESFEEKNLIPILQGFFLIYYHQFFLTFVNPSQIIKTRS